MTKKKEAVIKGPGVPLNPDIIFPVSDAGFGDDPDTLKAVADLLKTKLGKSADRRVAEAFFSTHYPRQRKQ